MPLESVYNSKNTLRLLLSRILGNLAKAKSRRHFKIKSTIIYFVIPSFERPLL